VLQSLGYTGYGARFHPGFCRVRVSPIGCSQVRCAFSDRNLHSRMPLDPTHVRLKLEHACEQWHSSRESTALIVVTINYVQTLKAEKYITEVEQMLGKNISRYGARF
jgi:hypothetical protein